MLREHTARLEARIAQLRQLGIQVSPPAKAGK
jgi:hypothetical protein